MVRAPEDGGTARPGARIPTSAGRRFVELFTLSGFAIAQPLFSVYGNAPEEFVFRHVDRVGVVGFTVLLLCGPPLAMWALGSLAAAIRASVGMLVHDLFMGALWFLLAVQILQRAGSLPLVVILLGAVVVSAFAIALAVGSAGFRMWVTFGSPAPVVFALIFVLVSPVSDQVRLSASYPTKSVVVGNPAPVVMIVLDELPLESVVDSDGQVDDDLYPHLAELGRESDTYLNTTSNAWATVLSVPSLLTGRLPTSDRLPVATTHGDNLFTLLGKSYDVRVHELLSLCPTSLCPQPKSGLVPRGLGSLAMSSAFTYRDIVDPRADGVDPGGAAFGDEIQAMVGASRGATSRTSGTKLLLPQRFADFLDDLKRPSRRPTLSFLHILMPHAPWLALPDGQTYVPPGTDPALLGLDRDVWATDQQDLDVARQRHLLQVQYTDALIGELMRQMRAAGTWDKSLVVITADHGEGFVLGQGRRGVSRKNADQVAWVPLFVKRPNERTGTTSTEPIQLIDVLPTMADILDVRIPWHVDGQSALLEERRDTTRLFRTGSKTPLRVDRVTSRADMLRSTAGSFAPRRGDPLRLYRIGPWADLVDRQVTELPRGAPARGVVSISSARAWADVDLDAPVVPAYLRATVEGIDPSARAVVVALNGRVAAASRIPAKSRSDYDLAVLLPPSQLRSGDNSLRFYALDAAGRLSPLQ
jgi:hypothetical protein